VASQNEIECFVTERDMRIGTGREVHGHAKPLHTILRQAANLLRNLDPVNFETEVVQQRHIPAVAEPQVKDLRATEQRAVELEVGIGPQESPHDKFHRINLCRVPL
jgi:hypothetical protein